MSSPLFTPPGPGRWELDRSHVTGGATPIIQWLMSDSIEVGFRKLWRTYGIPAETLSMRFVNGFAYTRLRPLIRPDHPSAKAPPALAIKVVSRLHPEFRRRARAAAKVLAESPAPPVIRQWHAEIKPRLIARNLELQAVDLGALDDPALAAHLETLLAHARETFEEHFRLHGYDLGPIGQLIGAGRDWGLAAAELVPALAGASPSTAAAAEALAEIRAGLRAAGVRPTSIAEAAAASPEVAEKLHRYLEMRGSVLFAGYDLDTPTLGEAPHVVLATINVDPGHRGVDDEAHRALVADLRERVPVAARARFDDLLERAREAMDLRDDNGPITAEWPCGLLRLAMLEAGARLAASGRLLDAPHVFELTREELPAMVRDGAGPSAEEVAALAGERAVSKTLDPPRTLGEPEAAPPLDALPAPLAELIGMVELVIEQMGMADTAPGQAGSGVLEGTGVGTRSVVGRARRADSAEEAFDVIEPGDILVTWTTSPAYNMVLTLVGGLVTAEGGPLSHAAVLSRELDIPAVVGARDAMRAIGDGDTIEVDPTTGRVTVIEPVAGR